MKLIMQNNNILTIGVPTYNRAFYLEDFFRLLFEVLKHTNNVKVLVSNNNSQDGTELICKKWVSVFSNHNIEVTYNKIENHLSGVENLLSLFKLVDTPYFMFLGDDDSLNKDGFLSALSILDHSPSAIIQNVFWNQNRSKKSGFVKPKESFKLFYEYGNAYTSIISTDFIDIIFKKNQLINELNGILWPQTVIGYLTILNFKSTKKVYIHNKIMGDCFVTGGTKLTSSEYWAQSLHDLLKAALMIKQVSNKDYAISSFISINSFGLLFHLESIAHYSVLQRSIPPIDFILDILKNKHFGIRGLILRTFLSTFFLNRFVFSNSTKLALMYKLRLSWNSVKRYINEKQIEYDFKINNVDYTKSRYKNWF